jgi:hypothetical protein
VRLLLEDDDPVKAESFLGRASSLIHKTENREIQRACLEGRRRLDDDD